jgi:hypothetical protein
MGVAFAANRFRRFRPIAGSSEIEADRAIDLAASEADALFCKRGCRRA